MPIASPWTRDLLTGSAIRTCGQKVVAAIARDGAGWKALARGGVVAQGQDREAAKRVADIHLAGHYTLVSVPGGCTIESDEPKKLQRVYREG